MLNGYKTLIGAGVALAAQLLALAGIQIDEAGMLEAILTIGGLVLAIVGRVTATRRVTGGPLQ